VELRGEGEVALAGGADGAVILFGHADPIGEPVFADGPFVLNTREEIIQAINDYNAGLFGTVG
jgi:redox-sensitive bicupin YhaK (pirin superfamily)